MQRLRKEEGESEGKGTRGKEEGEEGEGGSRGRQRVNEENVNSPSLP